MRQSLRRVRKRGYTQGIIIGKQEPRPLIIFGQEFCVNFHKMARGPNLRSEPARWTRDTDNWVRAAPPNYSQLC